LITFDKMTNLEESECVFCANPNTECELIEMATNSLVLEDVIIEFSDLIRNCLLFQFKVCC
jgi:hypothetical protein